MTNDYLFSNKLTTAYSMTTRKNNLFIINWYKLLVNECIQLCVMRLTTLKVDARSNDGET